MSRIGKLPIPVPSGVQVEIQGQQVTVKGPKGTLSLAAHPAIRVQLEDRRILCRRASDEKAHRALHGLTRSLLRNMVDGVLKGFERRLDLVGVGYRASLLGGNSLNLALGYSHPIIYPIPAGIKIDVKDQTQVMVSGIDKQLVGAVAAKIRSFRPPEPYKGKGVKYAEERIRRKAGKTGAK
ncbi:MAG: 50S ribosomal protein L6 [Zetaproteobacteria bacterium]|nr:MAG: 50S ribosomal protein L6 [Zetaproteobacteria bacterium]